MIDVEVDRPDVQPLLLKDDGNDTPLIQQNTQS